ncbi:N-succinyldiaminopimelate aminotransferase [Kribbella orskensis]|uniref:N-succinyldiaminopimelate aminotransferase n=1 Tax=Kribbella orskensis TaxID=2512216 RepID=A0ABY2BHT3_9ACTN|nr:MULTISPECIES: pyridoxal phosphate-dependent aminotransferase [Kribbella]TCM51206.1 N-succinyldiaminopimelate aminotransferase [Kribbella sp. VKM Ac-2568]TCN37025.1 N-succinyldiaminopimelate aminotransferase [Kribbella sp. VKM Ac-2500]TCO18450.1 N-succinyldiaminopimelate aminotransferase [Kribbella orskensis]
MREHAQRLQGLGTTIFAEMSALAVRTGSVNLGQGFPDTDGPDSLLEDAISAIRSGANQYPPGRGIPALRQAIVDHQKRFYGLEYDPDTQVLVTTGATEAIAAALLAYVEPGDEVIALEPYYDSYAACIAMAGGHRVPVTLRAPDFRLDLDELRAAVTPRTKVLLINSPHNPTGTVLTDEELRGVAAVAIEHDLVVITDEVYEHLIYDGLEHRPLTSYDGMAERTISIGSAGKTFSVTGWKIGWVTGTPEVVTAVNTSKQFLTYVSGAPFQPAVAGALALGNEYFDELRGTMQAKRDLLCDGLESLGFGVHRPQGTYFVTTDVRPLGYTDGVEFCRMLPEKTGVVAIPHQVFYDNVDAGRPLVRWAFCKQPHILEEALTRLTKL